MKDIFGGPKHFFRGPSLFHTNYETDKKYLLFLHLTKLVFAIYAVLNITHAFLFYFIFFVAKQRAFFFLSFDVDCPNFCISFSLVFLCSISMQFQIFWPFLHTRLIFFSFLFLFFNVVKVFTVLYFPHSSCCFFSAIEYFQH